MAMVLIQTQTLGASAASVTFSSIPGTYKTLILKVAARGASTTSTMTIQFNGSTANFTTQNVKGSGSAVSAATTSVGDAGDITNSGDTGSTFSNAEITMPNYAGAANKSYLVDIAADNQQIAAKLQQWSGLWSNTAAITSVTLANAANFAAASVFSLYGLQ